VQNFYNRTVSVHCTLTRTAGIVIWKPVSGNKKGISIGAMAGSYTENRYYKEELIALAFISYAVKGE